MHRLLTFFILGTFAFLPMEAKEVSYDLSKIGHLNAKGRVQDQRPPLVERLIQAGPSAIPFLVSKLEDRTIIHAEVMDYWPRIRVGDVALRILTDFFLTSDWKHSTIPDMSCDSLLERKDTSSTAWDLLRDFIAKHGRSGLRKRVETILAPYQGQFLWDPKEQCFRPVTQKETLKIKKSH